MCNCIEQTEAKIMEKFKNEIDHREILTGGFDHEAFIMVNGTQHRIAMPFTINYLKAAKTGRLAKKKLIQNMFPSYCSFCGEKLMNKEGA